MLHALVSGAVLGLFSLPHCALMCGPLASAACARRSASAPLRYQAGRTAGYMLAGYTSGQLGHVLGVVTPGNTAVVLFTALSAAACLTVAYGFVRSAAPRPAVITLGVAAPRRRITSALLRLLPTEPLLLGAVSALLPCGVLAAALLSAVATASAEHGALLMLGFVTTSGAAVLTASVLMRWIPRANRALRHTAAAALVLVAVVSVARPIHALLTTPSGAHTVLHCH